MGCQGLGLARQGGVGKDRDLTIKSSVFGRLRKLDGLFVGAFYIVMAPDDVLHGKFRRYPWATRDPADTTSEAKLKP